MSRLVDISGRRFNRLLVVGRAPSVRGETTWECRCDCGNVRRVRGKDLKRGFTTSCGCRNSELTAARNRSGAGRSLRTRKPIHPLKRTWDAMIHRCKNPNVGAFVNYGGRGIRVCERWQTFENFVADMEPRPTPRHTIERINNDGNYEPGNCRWATRAEQNRNTRSTRWLEHAGKRMPMADWCKETGIKQATLSARLQRGWSDFAALSVAPRKIRKPQ